MLEEAIRHQFRDSQYETGGGNDSDPTQYGQSSTVRQTTGGSSAYGSEYRQEAS